MSTTSTIPTWDLQDRLAKALKHARVSKEEMADYLDVSVNTINNYLAARTQIPGGYVRLWAGKTSVDLAWLLGEDSDATRPIVVRPNNNEGK